MWREFTHIVEADTEEVTKEVWAELEDKVQRVARRQTAGRQQNYLPWMMNWVRTAYKLCTTIYTLPVVLSFQAFVCVSEKD